MNSNSSLFLAILAMDAYNRTGGDLTSRNARGFMAGGDIHDGEGIFVAPRRGWSRCVVDHAIDDTWLVGAPTVAVRWTISA